jgi:hypothetical protein
MRNYEDSDPTSFNSFRTGNENPRRDLSTRNEFGTNQASMRPGSNEGTADHRTNSSPNQYSAYQPFNRQSNQQNTNWSQNDQNWQNTRGNYRQSDQGQNYNYGNQNASYRNDNRFNQQNDQHNWQNSQNRRHDDDRNFFERAGDRINESWNRWTDDDNNNDYNRSSQQFRNQNQYNQRFNDYNQQNRYPSDYDSRNNWNQDRNNNNRYQNRRNNEHDDEGFFDRMGNKISQAWDRFTGEDEEQRYQERGNMNSQHRWNHDFNENRGHEEDNPRRNYNRNDSWGSSNRDNEW